jgi:hypothetical protein
MPSPAPWPSPISVAASPPVIVPRKKRVQHIPKDWVEEVRRRVKAGREFQDAVREVLAANAQLLVLERKKLKKKKK